MPAVKLIILLQLAENKKTDIHNEHPSFAIVLLILFRQFFDLDFSPPYFNAATIMYL